VTQEILGQSDPSTTAGYITYAHVGAAAAVRALSIGPPGRSVSPDNEEPPVAVGRRAGT